VSKVPQIWSRDKAGKTIGHGDADAPAIERGTKRQGVRPLPLAVTDTIVLLFAASTVHFHSNLPSRVASFSVSLQCVQTSLTTSTPFLQTARLIVTLKTPKVDRYYLTIPSIYGRPILCLSDDSSLVSQSSISPPHHQRTQRPPSSHLGSHLHLQRLAYHRCIKTLHRQRHPELLLYHFHQERKRTS